MEKLKFINKPYIIKTKKYKTIDISIFFPINFEPDKLFAYRMLKKILDNTTATYPTEEEYKQEILKSMIINMHANYKSRYSSILYEFDLCIPNPKYVQSFDLNKAFKLFMDSIYKPNAKDGKFNEKAYNREKEYIISSIKNDYKQLRAYSFYQYLKNIDSNGEVSYSIYLNQDKINNLNPQNLYEYYQTIISKTPIIIVYGDVKESEINRLFKDYYKFDNKEYEVDFNFHNYLTPRKKFQLIEEQSTYKDSLLFIGIIPDHMEEKDDIPLKFLCDMLSKSETDLLLNHLRYKKDLVYSVDSYINPDFGFLTIELSINGNARDAALNGVKEVFESLNDEKLFNKMKLKLLKGIKDSLYRSQDNKYKPLDKKITELFSPGLDNETIYKRYESITFEEFEELLKRLKLDTVYFLRGEHNDK